jgi:hypothetical protein
MQFCTFTAVRPGSLLFRHHSALGPTSDRPDQGHPFAPNAAHIVSRLTVHHTSNERVEAPVSNIMMAHLETNSWSKLLTFISESQADVARKLGAPVSQVLFFRFLLFVPRDRS